MFDEMEQEAHRLGKPLPDPMSFIRDIGANIDHGRGWLIIIHYFSFIIHFLFCHTTHFYQIKFPQLIYL